jgi:hypothetical protein
MAHSNSLCHVKIPSLPQVLPSARPSALNLYSDTDVFQPSDGVVTQLKSLLFDSGEPSLEAREIERILFSRIREKGRARRLELRAAALGQHGNRRVGHRRRRPCHSSGEVIRARRFLSSRSFVLPTFPNGIRGVAYRRSDEPRPGECQLRKRLL